jgi:hypothetical protein
MTLAFPVIGSYLAWRVGNGSQVRVGEDAIMGCGRDIFLPDEIIQHLQVIGRCTLNLIDSPDDTSLWSQGWRKETDLGLQRWDHFLAELKKAHIRLNNSPR